MMLFPRIAWLSLLTPLVSAQLDLSLGATNEVVELDPNSGAIRSSFDASVVPGLTGGPDALALNYASWQLTVFSSLGPSVAGSADLSGGLVRRYAAGAQAIAAATWRNQGRFYVVTDPTLGGDGLLHGITESTALFQSGDPIQGYAGRLSALTEDPFTGRLVAYAHDTDELIELGVTGFNFGVTDVAPFLVGAGFPTGIAFDATGGQLFLAHGTGAGARTIVVLNRNTGSIGTNYCGPAVPHSAGVSAFITALGSTSASAGGLTLVASRLPHNQFAFFFGGQTQGFDQPAVTSGPICLAGNIGRFTGPGQTGIGPTLVIEVDTSAIPVNPPQAVVAGETWNFQCWYRNVPALPNFTNGVSVLFQ
ncbi:MAG: hypothetical protein GY711_30105 [bacterium]|nr:hypothetical protein [bacterium]